MSQGAYGTSRIDARGSSKIQEPPSAVKAVPSHRKYIDPAGPEFYPGGAAMAEIINIIKSNCNGSYRCWYKIPQSVRDTWFREFEKKFWWYPENHGRIRDLFEAHGCAQLNLISSQAPPNQYVKQFKSAEKSKNNNKSQVIEKIPFSGSISSSKHNNNKKEKYYQRMDEEQSCQSSMEDTYEDHNNDVQNWNIPAEVKEVMDSIGKEFHGKVMKSFEAVNRAWIQRVESLERERVELKTTLQLCVLQLQNYQNRQNDNIAMLKGLSEKLIIKDNSPSPPPQHHPKVVAFQPPPPPPPPSLHPKVAAFQPPPPRLPPAYNPKGATFRPTPPQYHPNFSPFPTPQPYQPNLSAHQAPPKASGYGFQGMQSLGQGNGYANKDDEYEEDDDFSEEYSDY